MSGAVGVASVRRGQGFPQPDSQIQLVPTAPLQNTAEPNRQDGGTLGNMCLRKGKKNNAHRQRKRGKNVRSISAITKVR